MAEGILYYVYIEFSGLHSEEGIIKINGIDIFNLEKIIAYFMKYCKRWVTWILC